MQGTKTVGTWSIDIEVKAWIDRKIANKSQFVNRILKNAMLDEIIRDVKKADTPKCPDCGLRMPFNGYDNECEHCRRRS